jgi:hypothetical protein
MTRRLFGICGALGLALVSGSCIDDPLADLDGTPAVLELSHSALQLSQGTTFPVIATVRDGRSTALAVPITATGCGAAVTAQADPDYEPVPPVSSRFILSAVGAAGTCVNFSGGGVTNQMQVVVLPTAFDGAPSATTLQVGQTLTLAATATLGFSPTTADIDFGAGYRGTVITRTATSLEVQVPVPGVAQPAPLTVNGVNVTYVPGLTATLPTASTFTITNPHDPNDAPLPATTATVTDTIFDGFAGGEVDNFYTLTLAAPTTFTVTLDWSAGYAADLDILYCNAGCTALVGNTNGATVANPEVSTVTLAAGTYNLWINNFVNSGATPAAPLYRIRITQ